MAYAFNDDKSKNDLSDVVRTADIADVVRINNIDDYNFTQYTPGNTGTVPANGFQTFTFGTTIRYNALYYFLGVKDISRQDLVLCGAKSYVNNTAQKVYIDVRVYNPSASDCVIDSNDPLKISYTFIVNK